MVTSANLVLVMHVCVLDNCRKAGSRRDACTSAVSEQSGNRWSLGGGSAFSIMWTLASSTHPPTTPLPRQQSSPRCCSSRSAPGAAATVATNTHPPPLATPFPTPRPSPPPRCCSSRSAPRAAATGATSDQQQSFWWGSAWGVGGSGSCTGAGGIECQ